MSFRDLIADTLRTLRAHKLRAALTMFGIAWGIVSITLMVAAGEGLRVGQARVAANFGKDILILFPGRTSLQAGGTRAGRLIRFQAADYEVLEREAYACALAIPENGRTMPVRSVYNSASLNVVGSLPPFADLRTIPVAAGRFYNEEDDRQARRVAFVGSDARKQLFAANDPIGQTLHIGDLPFTVIGVMQEKEQDSSYDGRDITKVYIPFRTMLRDFPARPPGLPDHVNRLIVTARDIPHHEECKAQVRRVLGRLHNFDPNDEEACWIWDTVENAKDFRKLTDGMKYFLGAVGIATLFLGGIGVMNVMLVAVRERTREIGIRKAIGATRASIIRQFFAETLILVAISGAFGLAISHGLCALVNLLPMPQFFAGLLPSVESTLISFALLGTVAILAALYPASRAASVDPIEALRFEAGG